MATDAKKRLADLLRGHEVAMLTHPEADGSLRSRPMMVPAQALDGTTLWLIIEASAAKFATKPAAVSVSCTNDADERFLALSGKATVVKDAARAAKLWMPVFGAWFKGGKDDPEVALLKIEVKKAEAWDARRGGLEKLTL